MKTLCYIEVSVMTADDSLSVSYALRKYYALLMASAALMTPCLRIPADNVGTREETGTLMRLAGGFSFCLT